MKQVRKSVSFVEGEDLCVYHSGAVMDLAAACPEEIWYQQNELAHIKRKAMVMSKEAHRYGFGSLLTNTYGKSCESTQDALYTWTINAGARRGLERWINNEYAAKRLDIRRRTINSVLRAQQKMAEETISDADYASKVLSRLSEAFSQDSRTFAMLIGIADQHAAKLEGDDHPNVFKGEEVSKLATKNHAAIALKPKRNLGLASQPASDFRHFY